MKEYITPAIILNREVRSEYDERVTFFSRQLGKMTARTISSKKILSKLSPHIEPGNLVNMRLVEKNDLSIVDALKERELSWQLSNIIRLENILAENEADLGLWHLLVSAPSWRRILKTLGWDPREATCDKCGNAMPRYFETTNQRFFCASCYPLAEERATIIIIEKNE